MVSHLPDANGAVRVARRLVETDEGPRPDSSAESLAKLRPVFAARGSVTAGNSSQMSDGAAAVILVSDRILREFNLQPLARFVSFAVAGVPPEVMGIGPVAAIPKVLERGGITQDALDWIELNEAFAAQSLAVMRELRLDPPRSTHWAAPSPWATRWAPPARSARPRWSMACAAPAASTGW